MRLFHYKLIEFLPRQQLLSQWRELNSIYKKQDNHILINYIYDYDIEDLFNYSVIVVNELIKRGYKHNLKNFCMFFDEREFYGLSIVKGKLELWNKEKPFKKHHDSEYLKICCWNLYEKYLRGQKGFTPEAIKFIKEKGEI